jgi:LysR family transcriptional activator of glutamate synthase operon
MTFRQMEVFIAVCDCKSINKASITLHVSQQGISKIVQALEEELGCQLLHRQKNGISPTQYGVYFLDECRTILERKKYMCSHISEIKDFPQEIIFLGMAFGVVSALPYKLISNFENTHPFVNIEYADHADFYLEKLLKKDEYDFCVTTGILDTDRFSTECLIQEQVYLCIPRTHELYRKKHIYIDYLKCQRYAMYSTEFHIRHNFIATCRNAGFDPIIDVSSGDFNSLREIALHNNLLFVVPAHTIRPDDSKLRYYKFPDDNFTWDVYFVKKKNKELTENMMAFYRYIKEQLPTLSKS